MRTATPADAFAIARLHARSWRTTYRGILADAYLDGPVDEDRLALWQARLSRPHEQMVSLIERGGELEAFVCVFLDRDPEWGALLENLHVEARARARGLGRALMLTAADFVTRSRPGSRLHLWVYEGNHPACRFYEHLGASLTARHREPAPDGSEVHALRYAWTDPCDLARATGGPAIRNR